MIIYILQYFVHQFRDIMHNESATDKELSLAIKGYGLLAGVCNFSFYHKMFTSYAPEIRRLALTTQS